MESGRFHVEVSTHLPISRIDVHGYINMIHAPPPLPRRALPPTVPAPPGDAAHRTASAGCARAQGARFAMAPSRRCTRVPFDSGPAAIVPAGGTDPGLPFATHPSRHLLP